MQVQLMHTWRDSEAPFPPGLSLRIMLALDWQDIRPFEEPDVNLEQYPTGAELASRLLFTVCLLHLQSVAYVPSATWTGPHPLQPCMPHTEVYLSKVVPCTSRHAQRSRFAQV